MTAAFDPYYDWLSIPSKDQPPHHYRLLGLELFEASSKVIDLAADRQASHVRSFQTGPNGEASQRLLKEISAARVCLLDAKLKAAYDAELRTRLKKPDLSSQPTTPTTKELRTRGTPTAPAPNMHPERLTSQLGPTSPVKKPQPVKKPPVLPIALGVGALLVAAASFFFVSRSGAPTTAQNDVAQADQPIEQNDSASKSSDLAPSVAKPTEAPTPIPATPVPEASSTETTESAVPAPSATPTSEEATPETDDGEEHDSGPATADRLIIHNSHNGDIGNAGARKLEIHLFRGDKLVWSKNNVLIPWAVDKDEKVVVDLPKRRFDRIRIEFPEWEPPLPSLAEVEIWSGTDNLARRGQAIASNSWQDRPQYAADKLNDGVTSSQIAGTGYWLANTALQAWVEIALPTQAKPASVEATAVETTPLRIAAPDDADRQRANRELREVYGQEIRAVRGSADKAKLATTLLGVARESDTDTALRFVLLSEAARLAGEAANPKLACEAIDDIGQRFQLNAWPQKVDAFRTGARTASTKEQRVALAQAASEVAKEALDARQYETALSIAKVTEGLLRQVGGAAELQQVRAFAAEVRTEKLRVDRQIAEQKKKLAGTELEEVLSARKILDQGARLTMTFDEPTLGRQADRVVVQDLSGSGKFGVVHGTALRPGVAGDCLRFDGRDDFVNITSFALDLRDYAVCVWVRGKGTILGTGQNAEWPLYWHLHTSGFVHHIEPFRGGGREYDAATARDTLTPEPLPADRWSHVAVCRAGQFMRFYVDGKLATENASYHTQPFVTHSNWGMFIGMLKTWGVTSPSIGGELPRTFRFEGLIDELAIFDRSLKQDEIAAFYQLGKHGFSLRENPSQDQSATDRSE